jgi:hypothetical protein
MERIRKARLMGACLTLSGAAALIGALGYHVPAAQADTDAGSTTANVDVTSAITLTNLTPSFTLSGSPGTDVTTDVTPVTLTVTTNNFAGYNVTVVPHTASLTPGIVGNTDVIAFSDLKVNGPIQGGTFAPLTFGTPLVVATKATASASDGDPITNDYKITVPFVRPDTYTGTLDYVTTTLL